MKYGGAIVPHVKSTTTTEEDSDEEDLLENMAPNLTPSKRSRSSDIQSGKGQDDISPYNNFVLAPWLHPHSGRKYTDAFILLPSGVDANQQYSINVSDSGTKLMVKITWPRILSTQDSLMKIAQMSDKEVTNMHPIFGGITECFK